jgi:hypothetical protein
MDEYVDLSHVIGTSDVVERLFSACKLVMTDRRKGMGPEMLDMIMMLKHNQDLWNADRDDERSYMAARILHLNYEERRRVARRLREETMLAMRRVDDRDEEEDDDFDLQGVQDDDIIGIY